MKEPVAVVIYETSDGRNFSTLEEAKLHEQILEVVETVGTKLNSREMSSYDICRWFLRHYDLIPRINVAS